MTVFISLATPAPSLSLSLAPWLSLAHSAPVKEQKTEVSNAGWHGTWNESNVVLSLVFSDLSQHSAKTC